MVVAVVVVVLFVPVVLVVIVVLVSVAIVVVVAAAVPCCCCCCCCCCRRLRFWSFLLVNISTTTISLTSVPTILINVLILSLFLPVLSFVVSPVLFLKHFVFE